MYVGVNFNQDTVAGSSKVIASTWSDDDGYAFFMMAPQTTTGKLRTGTMTFNSGGTGNTGAYESSAGTIAVPTGSRQTYSFYANGVGNEFKSYIDNSLIDTTSLPAAYGFWYSTSTAFSANHGKNVLIGNRDLTTENYEGRIYKFVMYNRSLTTDELQDIEDWMQL